MSKTIKAWLETLPEPHRSKALKNSKGSDIPKLTELDLGTALVRAFSWNYSPEGYEYWRDVHSQAVGVREPDWLTHEKMLKWGFTKKKTPLKNVYSRSAGIGAHYIDICLDNITTEEVAIASIIAQSIRIGAYTKKDKPPLATVQEYLNLLPNGVREKAIENCQTYTAKETLETPPLNELASNMSDALCKAFIWSNTPEGQYYWQRICNQYNDTTIVL